MCAGKLAVIAPIHSGAAIEWLLASSEPAIAYLARRDLLDEHVAPDPERIASGPIVSALLGGQQPDGGFGVHPYTKWNGAHWRLVTLVELGVSRADRAAVAAANTILEWLTRPDRRGNGRTRTGLVLRHASIEGNALAVCCRLGLADDPRVEMLARWLVEWQWPDGGWNCDKRATGLRSSFHESLPPMWGLHEYAVATGAVWAAEAADRTAELLLDHRLFRSHGTAEVINAEWLKIKYPPYWHYDILQALLILGRLGRLNDPRTAEAVEVVIKRRRRDGRWQPAGYWWSRTEDSGRYAQPDPAGWPRGGPSEMLTLNALRVLKWARGA